MKIVNIWKAVFLEILEILEMILEIFSDFLSRYMEDCKILNSIN